MKTIASLAASRIKYNKSRTLLTAIAIMLTTMLLMALATSAVGLLDESKQEAAQEGNVHAVLNGLTQKQLEMLKNHMDVESVECYEIFATVEYEKMNGYLSYNEQLKEGIYHKVGDVIEGHEAVEADEICGPAVFFERMGVEPVIGNKITISFRVNGEGMIETREFTICGIVSAVISELDELDISDSRISYSAQISKKLIDEFIAPEAQTYIAYIRVRGEDELNYDEMQGRIEAVAENIGYAKENVSLNKQYLLVMTDPGIETIEIVGVISLIIIIFSGLVIYSIYYVGVITDVQEIGKLKCLGASKKQIKRLLLTEGMRVSAIAIPIGLAVGFLLPYFILPIVINGILDASMMSEPIEHIRMFSLPILFLVVAVVLLTVYLSLLKPMKMAAKISPIEAIRYQESGNGKKIREGKKYVRVPELVKTNLIRNKKRTLVTMLTMCLSCTLFMSLAGVLNSMSGEDIARRNIKMGDFRLSLNYSANDKEYPENNLDSLQLQNIFSDEFVRNIESIDGVERVERDKAVLIGSDFPAQLFEETPRVTMSYMDRDAAEQYRKEVKRGELDYDAMVKEGGVLFTSDYWLDAEGLAIGDIVPLTVYDGDRQLSLTVKIVATVDSGFDSYFIVPKEVWDSLDMQFDSTVDLYITAEKDKYDSVKESLRTIADSQEYFLFYSMDEELELGSMQVSLIKYPLYLILGLIAVIGFMNLINTMITSIVTRKKELGILQAIGLTDGQLARMLAGEGMVFTIGSLITSVTLGNLIGYRVYLLAEEYGVMSVTAYHYPVLETILLVLALVIGQLGITFFIKKRIHRESLIDRIRSGE